MKKTLLLEYITKLAENIKNESGRNSVSANCFFVALLKVLIERNNDFLSADISREQDMLIPIPGLMPDPTEVHPGCSFAPRCPYCQDICTQEKPAYFEEGTHKILCHFAQRNVKKEESAE